MNALDAVVLDLVLAREAELLLDLDLDRQAVAVPAALAGDVLAAHRVEAGIEVLEEPGPHVVDAGPAVGGGRALVEDPLGRALAAAQALAEHVVVAPPASTRASSATRSNCGTGLNGTRVLYGATLPPPGAIHAMAHWNDCYVVADDAIVVDVQVQPQAGRSAVVGRHGRALKLRVAAPPVDGRANTAVAELLAELSGIKTAAVVSGEREKSRLKRFRLAGADPRCSSGRSTLAVEQAGGRSCPQALTAPSRSFSKTFRSAVVGTTIVRSHRPRGDLMAKAAPAKKTSAKPAAASAAKRARPQRRAHRSKRPPRSCRRPRRRPRRRRPRPRPRREASTGTKKAAAKARGQGRGGEVGPGEGRGPAKTAATAKALAKKAARRPRDGQGTRQGRGAREGAAPKAAPAPKPPPVKKKTTVICPLSGFEVMPDKPNLSPRTLERLQQKLIEERERHVHQADELQAEAESLAHEREGGDTQFDEESGEGDTVNVERERDLLLSATRARSSTRSTVRSSA